MKTLFCNKWPSLLIGFFAATACAAYETESDEFASTRGVLWNDVAHSKYIFEGELSAPTESLHILNSTEQPRYVELIATIKQNIKGLTEESVLPIQYFSRDTSYQVSKRRLIENLDRPAVLFLINADEKYYFSQIGEAALAAANEEFVLEVAAEVAEQDAILKNWSVNKDVPHYGLVGNLLNRISSKRSEQRAFKRLEELGPTAVPAIIAHLDNRTPTKTGSLRLKNNFDGAFEGYRHYGPEQLVDALAAILNQITGESFGAIYNGATDDERTDVINAWRIYGMKHPAFAGARPSVNP